MNQGMIPVSFCIHLGMPRSTFSRCIIALLILFQAIHSSGQAGPDMFKLTVINNSNRTAVSTVYAEQDKRDTIFAGQTKVLYYTLDDTLYFFYLYISVLDSTNFPDYKTIRIFNSRSKEIVINPLGKPEYDLTSQEKAVGAKGAGYRTENFWKLDSIVRANANNLAGAAIISSSLCNPDVPVDSIRKYFDLLTPEMQVSVFGKQVTQYLDNRSRLVIGKTLDDFELPDAKGKMIRLKEIKSHYILLDFWFSRCGPCIAAIPAITELYKGTGRNKLGIIGISIDKNADHELWLETIDKYNMVWVNLNDPKRKVAGSLAVGNFPTRVLLDKDRKIVMLDTNNSQDDFFKKVRRLALR